MDAIFIGGYACTLYSEYMTDKEKRKVKKTADFDVIIEDIEKGAIILKERLEEKIKKKNCNGSARRNQRNNPPTHRN